jgi:hypothetical protein
MLIEAAELVGSPDRDTLRTRSDALADMVGRWGLRLDDAESIFILCAMNGYADDDVLTARRYFDLADSVRVIAEDAVSESSFRLVPAEDPQQALADLVDNLVTEHNFIANGLPETVDYLYLHVFASLQAQLNEA